MEDAFNPGIYCSVDIAGIGVNENDIGDSWTESFSFRWDGFQPGDAKVHICEYGGTTLRFSIENLGPEVVVNSMTADTDNWQNPLEQYVGPTTLLESDFRPKEESPPSLSLFILITYIKKLITRHATASLSPDDASVPILQ